MKAVNTVYWPGRPTVACERHTQQLRNLDNVIGLGNLGVVPLPEDSTVECTNCANEAAKS